MAAPAYPFLFPNHGPIDPECIDKCEELWMWFSRDVTKAERKKIEEGAPRPLACFMAWDKRFAYFGSAGDSYDGEVIQAYGPRAIVDRFAEATANEEWEELASLFEEAQAHMGEAATAFAADVERWAREVHAIVPLVIFFGPHGGGEDDPWHQHSQRELAGTMLPLLAAYRADPEGQTHFGYIKRGVNEHIARHADEMDLGAVRPALLASLEGDYQSADLRVPFERLLSSSDSPLQHLGSNVRQALSGVPDAERADWLRRLSPFARLGYLASYSAAGSGDLDRFGDLPTAVLRLIAELPEARRHLAPWLVLWMAETLAQDTCAFDKKKRDTSRAGDAARVLDVALELPGVTARMWVGAVRWRSWAGQHEEALATARRGLDAFPFDKPLATEALAAVKAAHGKRKPTAAQKAAEDELAGVLEKAKTLDPDAFVTRSSDLAQKKKLAQLFQHFLAHLEAGGQLAPGVVCNGLFPIIEGIVPDGAFAERTFPRLIEAALGNQAFRLHDQATVQVGVALDKLPQHRALFVRLGLPHLAEPAAGLHSQLLWHAGSLEDAAAVGRVMARLDEALEADPEHLDRQSYTFENLACFALERGERERALGYLRRLQRADLERFQKTYRDEGLKGLWEDPDFEALHGKKKAAARKGKPQR